MELPGYRYDVDSKKYFKLLPREMAALALAQSSAVAAAKSSGNKRSKLKPVKKEGAPLSLKHEHAFRKLFESRWNDAASYKHEIDGLALSKYRSTNILYPDCLPLNESISCLSFDEDSDIVRIGGTNGSIATGLLDAHRPDYPNDQGNWRMGWCLPSPVNSLNTHRERMVATCLGPPAQAVISTTNETISAASVTLSPRKTSLWTSAISDSIVALGCDKKVLISIDPTRSSLLSYTTGSRHGDGAVYALDLSENLIFAGTRKGNVKIFDRRIAGSSTDNGETDTRAEISIGIDSPVTHVRRLSRSVLVAGLNGSLELFDIRFSTPRPVLHLNGHVNSYTRDIGLDVAGDFVAAGGQDGRVRIWSMRTGKQIRPKDESSWGRKFDEPIKAIRFRKKALWFADHATLECCAID